MTINYFGKINTNVMKSYYLEDTVIVIPAAA